MLKENYCKYLSLRSINLKINKMKKIIITLLLIVSTPIFSQVVIGAEVGSAGTGNASVLLDFPLPPNPVNGQGRGIILPYLRTVPSASPANKGTIILNASSQTAAKVVYSNGINWIDLSGGNTANITTFLSAQPDSSTTTEDASARAIIGDDTSSTDGVLVLESTSKAMVLPQVASTDDIVSPAPGMMVYINKAGAKRLAVFNGDMWAFWAAN